MPIRSLYIRLSPRELALLEQMADEERRQLQDQAAHLVSLAVHRWAAERELVAPFAAEEGVA